MFVRCLLVVPGESRADRRASARIDGRAPGAYQPGSGSFLVSRLPGQAVRSCVRFIPMMPLFPEFAQRGFCELLASLCAGEYLSLFCHVSDLRISGLAEWAEGIVVVMSCLPG